MSTLHALSQAAPAAHLALSALQGELARLQMLASQPEQATLRDSLTQLASLCQRVEHTLANGVHSLARAGDGLQGLLDLLQHAEDKPMPAHRLAGLLTPLQQQVVHASADIGQLL
ncbi:DUF1484 family protein [uncultured Aquitalea sp.]|uniref:DUF1484 family protein n=1 Tax=uncultured Aquitalea sp. TaxID=540272 RepID=UPI0025F59CD0|nr:DUF1484 family protein [uncultured Aquitalea sp.]